MVDLKYLFVVDINMSVGERSTHEVKEWVMLSLTDYHPDDIYRGVPLLPDCDDKLHGIWNNGGYRASVVLNASGQPEGSASSNSGGALLCLAKLFGLKKW